MNNAHNDNSGPGQDRNPAQSSLQLGRGTGKGKVLPERLILAGSAIGEELRLESRHGDAAKYVPRGCFCRRYKSSMRG